MWIAKLLLLDKIVPYLVEAGGQCGVAVPRDAGGASDAGVVTATGGAGGDGQWPRRRGAYTGTSRWRASSASVDAREATGEEECGSGESDKEHAKVERLLVPHPLEC